MIPTRAEEWVATLKEMHEAGDSYAVIAKRLGVTKNVVARADGGPSPRRCQFPMWPHSAPTPRLDAHLDVRTTFGPHLLCGAPSVPGRSWCAACCARVFTPRERAA